MKGIPGLEFDAYARGWVWPLLARGNLRKAVSYLVWPIHHERYFEFAFALRSVPKRSVRCFDVSSPRIFSLFYARKNPKTQITVANPDLRDLAATRYLANVLRLRNIRTEPVGVEGLRKRTSSFDCIWSISVIEHISGAYDDREAIRCMYEALAPAGTLVLTFPVDRTFREESRAFDPYGTQLRSGERFFFQRYYDPDSIRSRLLAPIGYPEHTVEFFGETSPGTFAAYEARSRHRGLECTVEDPREIADNYKGFMSWDEMPGAGFCGLVITKAT